jgi:hypothetical protein
MADDRVSFVSADAFDGMLRFMRNTNHGRKGNIMRNEDYEGREICTNSVETNSVEMDSIGELTRTDTSWDSRSVVI